jgi:hypothetical protein
MRLVILEGRGSDFGKLFFQALITDTVADHLFDTGKSPIISGALSQDGSRTMSRSLLLSLLWSYPP